MSIYIVNGMKMYFFFFKEATEYHQIFFRAFPWQKHAICARFLYLIVPPAPARQWHHPYKI